MVQNIQDYFFITTINITPVKPITHPNACKSVGTCPNKKVDAIVYHTVLRHSIACTGPARPT